ncbi:MAG: AAA family ATPase [Elusimicrobia bacterium]|nr:AAA family ATPase [Candidatus Liberimonas magnetica]
MKTIGFVGKGGTGKTTLTALFLKYWLSKNKRPVLVIDADPNSCLGDLLSLKIDSTIGSVRHELIKKKEYLNQTAIPKPDYCEYAINNAIVESQGFDMITMGKSDGPGCYCYVNNIVKMVIEKLQKNYELILVDCEAGLEHFSRKTLGDMNTAFIVSDLSKKGILTGIKQAGMMKELGINTRNNYLIINNVRKDEKIDSYVEFINKNAGNSLKFAGIIRNDENIPEYEFKRKSFLDLPEDSVSYQNLNLILNKIDVIKAELI